MSGSYRCKILFGPEPGEVGMGVIVLGDLVWPLSGLTAIPSDRYPPGQVDGGGIRIGESRKLLEISVI
jgi:hypothetical protein